MCCYSLVDLLVRGTEGIVRDLIGCDPCDGVVLQEPDLTVHDLSMEQREVNRDVGVLVYDIHEDLAN